jgi:hypothetical protein
MLKKLLFLIPLFFLVACAKRGTIYGGHKDTIPPVMKLSEPKNFSTQFKGNTIKLTFDEYVILKDINKQLIVSPPMENTPEITPSNASKVITIKFKDTLLPNTTYSLNFGQSIKDHNEGNPYNQFTYTFSTGNYIDSLQLKGTIKDALEKKADNFVSIMLYEMNEKFNDSIIYNEKPRYVTNTLDSATSFTLENLKAGKYLLVALKDNNNNLKYDPKQEKIGFYNQAITLPDDAYYEIELFKEEIPFKANKPNQASGNRITMGYEGNPKDLTVILKNGSDILKSQVTRLPNKDSVQIWFPKIKTDSLALTAINGKYQKNFSVKIKDQKVDTLSISPTNSGNLHFRKDFSIKTSTPIASIDETKITFTNKDSINVAYTLKRNDFNQEIIFDFKKEPLEKYKITLLPDAITDIFGQKNDTLNFKFTTKNTTEYGNLIVKLENVKSFPIIVELTDDKGKVLASEYSQGESTINFFLLEPYLYSLRLIYDENKNKVWDSGNYLEKRQTEEVIYFPKVIDVRSNWDVEQPFTLPNPK